LRAPNEHDLQRLREHDQSARQDLCYMRRPQARLISKVAIAARPAAAVLLALTYVVPQYVEDDLTIAIPDSAAQQH
jgi:bifunctional DNase/RNase